MTEGPMAGDVLEEEVQSVRGPTERKYWTQAPNLYDDADLTVHEFRLLLHYKRVGTCFEGTRTTARRCHMSLGSVVVARRSLASNGWIKLGDTDRYGRLRIELVDVWVQNNTIYGGPDGRCSPGEHLLKSVHDVNALASECSLPDRDRSPHEHPRSPGERKKNYLRRTKEEEPKTEQPRAADSPAPRSKSDRVAGVVYQICRQVDISHGQALGFSSKFTPSEAAALADAARRMEPSDLGAYAAQLFRDHLVEP